MPERSDVSAALRRERFEAFQTRLESVHGWVRVAGGGERGQMSTARSPADLMFLRHANVDRLWADWQKAHPRKRPKNADEILKPSSTFGLRVSEVLSLSKLKAAYS